MFHFLFFVLNFNRKRKQHMNVTSSEWHHDVSLDILVRSKKISIYGSIFLIILGLIGHSLTIFVFIQKRFRQNSSNVFLLCLAITDALYLIVHFFEDTIKTARDVYSENYPFILLLNIIGKFISLKNKFALTN